MIIISFILFTVPRSITNLQVVSRSNSTIDIDFDGSENAASYFVEVLQSLEQLQSFSISSTETQITGLSSASTYIIRVQAENVNGASDFVELEASTSKFL